MALEPSSKAIFSKYLGSRKYTVRHVDVDGQVYFETRQDCEPIVEHVKQMRGQPVRSRDSIAWDLLGEIPMSVFGEWMRDGRDQDPKFIRRWLDQNPSFKVYGGSLV